MLIINTRDVEELAWSSPRRTFAGFGKQISEALGRDPNSTDLERRHPFDIEIQRIAPGASPCPYHAHSAQWEFYHVISGTGRLRHRDGATAVGAGDAFVCKPGEPHQLINDGATDLVLYVVADNPIGESHFYPDSNKWGVSVPERRLLRSAPLEYYDGEE